MAVPTQAPARAGTPPVQRELNVLALIDHLVMGGAEMLIAQFAAAAPSVGIRLSVACLAERDGNPAAAPLEKVGITPQNLNVPGPPGPRTLGTVRRHIAATSPDIVHTHLGTSDWVGGLVSRSLGIPMVCSVHTTTWGHDLETFGKRMLVRLCAARIIAVSDSARDAYARRGWGSEGQLVTIHNGVDVTPAPGAGPAVRREFGWDDGHLVVGMLSALRPEKAHDLALDAVRLLRDRFPALRLLIIGRGPSGEHIARLAGGLGETVRLAGARSDVMRCLDAFDICLHPSHSEAFPTTLIEAMAASVPVLATAVGGIPEIVSDGQTGVLVPSGSSPEVLAAALADLLSDRSRRLELGNAGRETYETRFTARPWARSTRGVYDEVLAQSRAPLLSRALGHSRVRQSDRRVGAPR